MHAQKVHSTQNPVHMETHRALYVHKVLGIMKMGKSLVNHVQLEHSTIKLVLWINLLVFYVQKVATVPKEAHHAIHALHVR